jgi:hypothetical protein
MADKPDFATARKTLVAELYEIFPSRWQTAVSKAASLDNVSKQSDGNVEEFGGVEMSITTDKQI